MVSMRDVAETVRFMSSLSAWPTNFSHLDKIVPEVLETTCFLGLYYIIGECTCARGINAWVSPMSIQTEMRKKWKIRGADVASVSNELSLDLGLIRAEPQVLLTCVLFWLLYGTMMRAVKTLSLLPLAPQVYETHLAGFEFWVLDEAFAVHRGMRNKRARAYWRERQNAINRRRFLAFQKELKLKYHKHTSTKTS